MKTLQIYGNVATRRASDASGSQITLPRFFQGDFIRTKMRLLDKVDGSIAEINPAIRSIKASITRVQAVPTSGYFKLQVDVSGVASAKIQSNQDGAKVGQIIGALAELSGYGPVTDCQDIGDSCWVVKFDYNGEVPLKINENGLTPQCDIRIRAYQKNGVWLHEIKLIQLPIAFTTVMDFVLGPAPTPRQVIAGSSSTVDGVTYLTNEVQAYTLDPSFRNTYRLKIKGLATPFFSPTDGIDTIQSGLNNAGIPGAQFIVSTPQLNQIYVEFGGSLSGVDQDMMEIEIGDGPPGDIQFDLNLETSAAEDVFRETGRDLTDFVFECELVVGEDGEISQDTPGHVITVFRESITIIREGNYKELDTVADIDWLKPPYPKDYIPFTSDQVITGTQFYTQSLGDGTNYAWSIAHNLGTRIGHITVQENKTNGKVLTPNADYTATFTDNNSIEITFSSAVIPTVAEYVVTFSTAGPVSAFLSHTHTEGQVVGLIGDLDAIRARLAILESYLPGLGGGILGSGSNQQGLTIALGNQFELINYKVPLVTTATGGTTTSTAATPTFAADGSGLNAATLPKNAPLLLPALTVATVGTITTPLPAASGYVDQINTAAADVTLAKKYGGTITAGDPIGCDGRTYYAVEKGFAADSTYYPKSFERTLWAFGLNDVMLALNSRLDVTFGVAVQIANANTDAEWVVCIEKGSFTSLTTPGTPDLNLSSVVWDSENPIVAQKIFLSNLLMVHTFGLRLLRTGNTAFTMDRMAYGFYSGANGLVPATANFALRARLYKFDISDNPSNARGWVAYQLVAPITSAGSIGAAQAVITAATT